MARNSMDLFSFLPTSHNYYYSGVIPSYQYQKMGLDQCFPFIGVRSGTVGISTFPPPFSSVANKTLASRGLEEPAHASRGLEESYIFFWVFRSRQFSASA